MPPTIPLHSRHQAALLASLYFQGQSNDCGPYTTATVLKAARGLQLDPAGLAEKMNRPVWRGPMVVVRRVPNWATFPWGIADVLSEHGLEAKWRFFASEMELWDGIQAGEILMPVVGAWRPLWAHVMSLVAYDPQLGWGFANTQYNHHNIHWLRNETFQHQWRAMARLLVRVPSVPAD
jgi:hypothetical protein